MKENIKQFIKDLQERRTTENVFNPWRDYDEIFDVGPQAPKIRSKQMERFLALRIAKAKYLLVAEAVGYQGGKFTGMALTSERMLLGFHKSIGSSAFLENETAQRTSKPDNTRLNDAQRRFGFTEPTATIVWKEILEHKISPFEVITWNIFPFHPFDPRKGSLTNRTPNVTELKEGMDYTKMLLKICPNVIVISIGRYSAETLNRLGIENCPVPHPANGNALKFRKAIRGVLKSNDNI